MQTQGGVSSLECTLKVPISAFFIFILDVYNIITGAPLSRAINARIFWFGRYDQKFVSNRNIQWVGSY